MLIEASLFILEYPHAIVEFCAKKLFAKTEPTKAVTYERPKMKRDVQQKGSLFSLKRLLFCQASLFIFGRSLYFMALVATVSKCAHK